ncbi:hypothetical protein LEP1GSC170_2031 [Leptospira interrogans serovar Bataviae str. HAI135]|nr:hypothetical protein LEP1GSC170_2031 [Leptospira interrogans serovar Bataviae str. HAI135]
MKIGIFGLGYTGIRIAGILKSQTGIELETFSSNTQIEGTLIFDFSNASMLENFSGKFSKNSFDLSLVTFPIQKLSDPFAFLDVLFSVSKILFCLELRVFIRGSRILWNLLLFSKIMIVLL